MHIRNDLLGDAEKKMLPEASVVTLAPYSYIVIEQCADGKDDFIVSMHRFPAKLATARTPDEVKRVVVIEKRSVLIRRYVPCGSDMQWVYHCWVFDPQTQAILKYDVFKCDIPGDRSGSLANGVPRYGSEPWDEVNK